MFIFFFFVIRQEGPRFSQGWFVWCCRLAAARWDGSRRNAGGSNRSREGRVRFEMNANGFIGRAETSWGEAGGMIARLLLTSF